VLRPRRIVPTFTLYSGNVYSAPFDYGRIVRVWANNSELTEGSSPSLSTNSFYYDADTETLYVRVGVAVDPATKTMVVAYELYVGTTDSHFYRVPTDSNTTTVYFEPMMKQSPNVSTSVSDSLFGFMPVQTASMVLSNATHFFDRHLYDSTFHQAELFLYHALGPLEVSNIRRIFYGTMGDVSFSNAEVSVQVFNRLDVFSSEFRHPLDDSFYGTTNFPDLDPNFNGRPIRMIYGLVEGHIPVNIDYVLQGATSSDNRNYVLHGGQSNIGNAQAIVAASPASTTTRTYISTSGFLVGDSVWLDRSVGSDEYKIVTAVDPLGLYIEHSALASPMSAGDLVKRSVAGNIVIYQNNVRYQPLYGRDYLEASFSGNTTGFAFANAFETTLGMATLNPANDRIFCRVYGKKNAVTINGNPVGANDSLTGNMVNPISIAVDILKTAGILDSELDETALITLASTTTSAIGMALPDLGNRQFPIYRDIISDIMKSILGRFFMTFDNKWAITVLEPITTPDTTIDDNEIIRDSFKYKLEHTDLLSDVFVEYGEQETQDSNSKTESTRSTVKATNSRATYLHQVKKQQTFESLLFRESDAQTLAERLSYVFGERRGLISLSTKNRFFSTIVSDNIEISSLRMPGFEFDGVTQNARLASVIETQKGLRAIDITLDDLKGVNDNSLNW
jgi:hypothetical protein